MMRVAYDMETGDPDDPMTLAILATHPAVKLVVVTVTPGTRCQVSFVRRLLARLGREDVLVGAYDHERDGQCLNERSYGRLFGESLVGGESDPDGKGCDVLSDAALGGSLTVVSGAPLKNARGVTCWPERWVAQGGFAGDSMVSPESRLEKFAGMETCPTYNLNGDPTGAFELLKAPTKRWFVSKNVCHGVIFDRAMHEDLCLVRGAAYEGLEFVLDVMGRYLERRPEGKKFHDPLAACCAISGDVCEFREVEMYREKGKWGSRLVDGTDTFISVSVDRGRMMAVLKGGGVDG